MTAREALSLPNGTFPGATPVDDQGGLYDHMDAWRALRAAASGDVDDLDDMGGVLVQWTDDAGRRQSARVTTR